MTINVTLIIFAMECASAVVACRVLKWKVSKGAVSVEQEFVLAIFFFQIADIQYSIALGSVKLSRSSGIVIG